MFGGGVFGSRLPGQLWATSGTRDRFGVESTVGWVAVFGGAGGTQRKRLHDSALAVVRQFADDRGAGPAVGAVRERVAVPTVRRVEHFAQAIRAGCDIGWQLPALAS